MRRWIAEADVYRLRRALREADPDARKRIGTLLLQAELRLREAARREPRADDLLPTLFA